MGIAAARDVGSPIRNLEIQDIPSSARLVLVVGRNGSGKSTLLRNIDSELRSRPAHIIFRSSKLVFHGQPTGQSQGDSAQYGQQEARKFFFDLFARSGEEALGGGQTAQEVASQKISPFAELFNRVFPNLKVEARWQTAGRGNSVVIINGGATYDWTGLSSGELRIFGLLLGLMHGPVGNQQNAIYVLDEPDTNVHAELQSLLLEECFHRLSSGSQLWIATQSIGMIYKAVELHKHNPGEIVFLELSQDFAAQKVLRPIEPDRNFTKRVLAVALHDLADLVAPKRIVICEGAVKHVASGNAEFDAKIYSRIFGLHLPDTEFVSSGGCNDIIHDSTKIQSALQTLLPGVELIKLIDNDCDRSDPETMKLQNEGITILSRRSIESYLWDDEVLEKLCNRENRPADIPAVLQSKRDALKKKPGDPIDDCDNLKAACGEIMSSAKKLLGLQQAGSTKDAFAIETLAPLITPDTKVYKALFEDIFGRSP